MKLGLTLILVALGGILAWSVRESVAGIDYNILGLTGFVLGSVSVALTLSALAQARARQRVDNRTTWRS